MALLHRLREAHDRLEDGTALPFLSICVLFAMTFVVASFGG